MYNLSKDYEELYKMLCKNNTVVVGFVDYNFQNSTAPPSRDVCKIRRFKEYDISFGARGIGYGSVSDYFKATKTEKEVFLEECKMLNLEYIPY